jgi:hypothetical protein
MLPMTDKREPVISRTYNKGTQNKGIFVYLITGPEITGTVFEFAIFLDNEEQKQHQTQSGNKYEIRKKFINHLLDLTEDGWKKMNAATYNSEHRQFFEPENL